MFLLLQVWANRYLGGEARMSNDEVGPMVNLFLAIAFGDGTLIQLSVDGVGFS